MTRVVAFASMLSEPISGSLVERALGRGMDAPPSGGAGDELTAEAIQDAVARVAGVPRAEILSPRRTPRVAQARQLAMYLCRELTPLSLAEVARAFDRDHSTVMHAVRAVSARIEPDSETAAVIHDVKSSLRIASQPADALSSTGHGFPPQPAAAVPRETVSGKPKTSNPPHSPTSSNTSEPDRKMIGS
jgi:chromosomal replication initiator protein